MKKCSGLDYCLPHSEHCSTFCVILLVSGWERVDGSSIGRWQGSPGGCMFRNAPVPLLAASISTLEAGEGGVKEGTCNKIFLLLCHFLSPPPLSLSNTHGFYYLGRLKHLLDLFKRWVDWCFPWLTSLC